MSATAVKSDNPNVKSIKHMAFAVRDAKVALEAYAKFLHVPADTKITDYPKSKNRVALFNLGGIEYQRAIERAALTAGGGAIRAPATRASDFLKKRGSSTLPGTSYLPGLTATDIDPVLEAGGVPIAGRLRSALRVFEKRMRGYAGDEAVLVATESRTSSPVSPEARARTWPTKPCAGSAADTR